MPDVTIWGMNIHSFGWTVAAGVVLFVAGVVMILTVKPHYALRIFTAEGENDVIVSPRREYVRQIIDALNRAFMMKNFN